jgi:hypothetical protein
MKNDFTILPVPVPTLCYLLSVVGIVTQWCYKLAVIVSV